MRIPVPIKNISGTGTKAVTIVLEIIISAGVSVNESIALTQAATGPDKKNIISTGTKVVNKRRVRAFFLLISS
jgi:hypothetical protein